MCSGTAVAGMARERLAKGQASLLAEYAGGDLAKVDAAMVEDAARSGDGLATDIIASVATNLGIGIVDLLHAFDPEIIVIGAGCPTPST